MTGRKNRILAVDDHPTNLEILRGILQPVHEVDTAERGLDAITLAKKHRPDIVLLDIMMPGMDGYEVCRQMRQDPNLRSCKILMLTAKSTTSDRLKGFEAGADDYLTKPFDAAELLAKVSVFLRLKSVEEVDQMKADLLTLLNHETRTPLNGIISPAEMLLEGESMTDDERHMWIEMIYQNSKDLLSFIQKATLLNALSSGYQSFTRAPVLLSDIVEAQLNLAEHGNSVISYLDDSVIGNVDTAEFGNAVHYLISFAISQSSAPNPVIVRLVRATDTAHLSISFAGELDSDHITSLFDGLGRADVFHHHRDQSALELAIANEVLDLHNCKTTVQPISGKTRIAVEIPLFDMPDVHVDDAAVPVAGTVTA